MAKWSLAAWRHRNNDRRRRVRRGSPAPCCWLARACLATSSTVRHLARFTEHRWRPARPPARNIAGGRSSKLHSWRDRDGSPDPTDRTRASSEARRLRALVNREVDSGYNLKRFQRVIELNRRILLRFALNCHDLDALAAWLLTRSRRRRHPRRSPMESHCENCSPDPAKTPKAATDVRGNTLCDKQFENSSAGLEPATPAL